MLRVPNADGSEGCVTVRPAQPTAAAILHELAGSPEVPGCAPVSGPCAVCGYESARGMTYSAWQGANSVDQSHLQRPEATIVCESCVWSKRR